MLWILLSTVLAANAGVEFDRQRIGDTTYEAASVFDVDNDGHLDVVSGEYWHAGPDWAVRHKICPILKQDDYYDDFSDYPMDVNGDGYLDIVSGAWWGMAVQWRENPKGKPVEWTNHEIAKVGNVERPCFWDIDGDGHVEIVPNTPGSPQQIFKLVRDAKGNGTGKFVQHQANDIKGTHGLGFGDLNGDDRGDLIFDNGWLEAPAKPLEQTWEFHADFSLGGSSSVPILVHDVNGDGKADIIVGQGHNYGVAWWEQGAAAEGARTWARHDIETKRTQYHEMALADLDGDGKPELITGKRWRAHPAGDPGVDDPVGIYWYAIDGGKFTEHIIDFGDPKDHSGTGIYMWIMDVNGDKRPDILAPGKEGMYLFTQRGN